MLIQFLAELVHFSFLLTPRSCFSVRSMMGFNNCRILWNRMIFTTRLRRNSRASPWTLRMLRIFRRKMRIVRSLVRINKRISSFSGRPRRFCQTLSANRRLVSVFRNAIALRITLEMIRKIRHALVIIRFKQSLKAV